MQIQNFIFKMFFFYWFHKFYQSICKVLSRKFININFVSDALNDEKYFSTWKFEIFPMGNPNKAFESTSKARDMSKLSRIRAHCRLKTIDAIKKKSLDFPLT